MTRPGTCAICKKDLVVGEKVYFDPTKPQGSHLAHVVCWDTLRKSRTKAKPRGTERLSEEPLDPPF